MKKLKIFILILICSCTSVTEEIYLNKDGSGEYLVYSDVIASTRGMMLGMMSSIYPDASEDSLKQIIDDKIWADMPSEVDSLIDYSERVPDSIKNDPDKMKYLQNMKMFMKGSRAEGFINTGMSYKFDEVSQLEDFLAFMNENQSATGGGMGADIPNMQVKYSFDGKSFSRTTVIAEKVEMDDSTQMALNTMLEGATSRLIIHFPKKVKKASTDQLVEKNGKDVIYEFDLLKVLNGEQSSDVTINF